MATSFKYLGIVLDEKLSWKKHIADLHNIFSILNKYLTHLGAFKKVIKSRFKQSAIFRPQILNQPPQTIKTKNLQYDTASS